MSAKKKPAKHRIISHWTPPRTPDFNVEPDIEYGVKLKRAFILQAVAPPAVQQSTLKSGGAGEGVRQHLLMAGFFFADTGMKLGVFYVLLCPASAVFSAVCSAVRSLLYVCSLLCCALCYVLCALCCIPG